MEISRKALCGASGKTVRKDRVNEVEETEEAVEVKEQEKRSWFWSCASSDGVSFREETVRRAKIWA